MFIVAGAGLTGAIIAERLATELKRKVIVLERRDHIAGNIYDYSDDSTGILVHKYGPHIFHTNDRELWRYLSRFTQWQPYFHRVQAVVDGNFIGLPVNMKSLANIFPPKMAEKYSDLLIAEYGYGAQVPVMEMSCHSNSDIAFCGTHLYKKIYRGYTCKQWGIEPEQLDPSILARVPVNIDTDNRYFKDVYQGIPRDGYTRLIENILTHPLIEIHKNTSFDLHYGHEGAEAVIFTGQVDELFDCEAGALPYRGLSFEFHKCRNQHQTVAQVNYPENYDFTRITEFSHFLPDNYSGSIVAFEYPQEYVQGVNEPFYPVLTAKSKILFENYRQKTQQFRNFYLCGRLGLFQYLNMDQAVRSALELAQHIINNTQKCLSHH